LNCDIIVFVVAVDIGVLVVLGDVSRWRGGVVVVGSVERERGMSGFWLVVVVIVIGAVGIGWLSCVSGVVEVLGIEWGCGCDCDGVFVLVLGWKYVLMSLLPFLSRSCCSLMQYMMTCTLLSYQCSISCVDCSSLSAKLG
jgi:hypothetical protein